MRDYRRRQRIEGSDIESSPEASPPSSSASPPIKSPCQSSEAPSRRQSNTQSLSVQSVNLRRHSSGTSSDNPPLTEAAQAARGKRRSTQTPLEGETSRSSRRRREVPRAQHGVFSQFMINLPKPTTPPTIGEDLDQLNSSADLGRMLDACEEYNTWLHSSSPPDVPASKRNNKAYDDKTSQMLLCALSLKSVGQLEAVKPTESKVDKNLLKTRVLALLNKRLKNPNKALEDNTIGALACLASYEVNLSMQVMCVHVFCSHN